MSTQAHSSWRRALLFLPLFLVFALIVFFISCRRENIERVEQNTPSIYTTNQDLDTRILEIIRDLKSTDTETGLSKSFAEAEATPLWECSILSDQGIDTLLFVPVYSKRSPDEIQTIWKFQLHGDKTFTHRFYHSNAISEEDQWGFDYFTTFALGKRPKSGTTFSLGGGTQIPRGFGKFVERCVDTYYYAGLEGSENDPRFWKNRKVCWKIFLISSAGPDEGNRGGGGGSDRGNRPIPGGGGGGGTGSSSGGGGLPKPEPDPLAEFFDKVVETEGFQKSRAKEVLDVLLKSGKLAKILTEFFTPKPPHLGHLKLLIDPLPCRSEDGTKCYVWGNTDGSEYRVLITINSDYISRMSEEHLAATILHEMIHARLRILVYTLQARNPQDYAKAMKEGYPGLFDYYHRYKDSSTTTYSHEMFHHYEQAFVKELYDLYKTKVSKEKCEALFWWGLMGTEAWRKLPKEKQDRYKAIQDEELKNVLGR